MSDSDSVREVELESEEGNEVAVISVAGRFPGASSIDELWRNLRAGLESVGTLDLDELEAWGADPEIVRDPSFVPRHGAMDDVEQFDAGFFGFNNREAEILDPQQRWFLQVCWEAMERAGYDTERYDGAVGVFAGAHANFYLQRNIHRNLRVLASVGHYQAILNNLHDSLATRVSYKLNLRGPSVSVQCACSTSLVAIHMAVQSLLSGECDMALAGGATIIVPQGRGYVYQEGLILSPDGHCRSFDARAKGIVTGDGVGAVLLKRLDDAQRDGDPIAAVILGSAMNNDGSNKVGYTAPGLEGQRLAIEEAQAVAGVEADSISYVEAHGTATSVGDPLEVAALTQAFRSGTEARQFCGLGSVKSNFGHLDAAAGVTGFIKTVLALQNREIPPSLHFEEPNPDIDFDSSPFFVIDRLREWQPRDGVRRAGVSAFGIGGTNAHVILEEAPESIPAPSSRDRHLVVLSARTEGVLATAGERLASHLEAHPEQALADVAYTLQVGRREFPLRRAVVGRDAAELAASLRGGGGKRAIQGRAARQERSLVFLFPGQGAQYVGMGRGLYETEAVFREQVDRSAEALRPHLGLDLREVLFAPDADPAEAAERLKQTAMAQPALFVVEYAMARLWMEWGLTPAALVGHSVGEYTAACLASVLSLEDALALVAARGRMMQSLPAGDMMAVPLPASEVEPLLDDELSLGAVNAPELTVVSGPAPAVARLSKALSARGVEGRILETSHAFHSRMMEPILEPFRQLVSRVTLSAPTIPFVSTVTGEWITEEQATSVDHWVANVGQAVLFSRAAETLLADGAGRAFLEVGPGTTLGSLLRMQGEPAREAPIVSSLRHPLDDTPDDRVALESLGRLWCAGLSVDWRRFHAAEPRRRVVLPTYPFELKRHWVQPKDGVDNTIVLPSKMLRQAAAGATGRPQRKRPEGPAEWYYLPGWKSRTLPAVDAAAEEAAAPCLVLARRGETSDAVVRRLRELGHPTVVVHPGETFRRISDQELEIDVRSLEDHRELVRALAAGAGLPERILHLGGLGATAGETPTDRAREAFAHGLYSALYLVRSLDEVSGDHRARIRLVTSGLQDVAGSGVAHPEKAAVLGACRVVPQEFGQFDVAAVDVEEPSDAAGAARVAESLVAELAADTTDAVVAYRGGQRWIEEFQEIRLGERPNHPRLRRGGVYLVTGGVGGIGLTFAEFLARRAGARLVLTGRSEIPGREAWDSWVAEHGPEDRTSRKIARFRELEALGAEVLALAADAADPEAMRSVVAAGRDRFGPFHGVIHAAGIASDHPIRGIDPEQAAGVVDPKVYGALVVDELLADDPLDFVALMSSMNSVVGGIGQVDYAAANAFLDALAASRRGSEPLTVATNWDAWDEVGMAARYAEEKGVDERSGWITPADGTEALARVLAAAEPQVIVSKRDFFAARAQFRDLRRGVVSSGARAEAEAEAGEAVSRDDLSSDFAAPETATQRVLAQIWKDLLAVDRVGIDDDFFELGGHSLLGTQVVALAREQLGVEVVLRDVLASPTIRELGELLESMAGGSGNEAGGGAEAAPSPVTAPETEPEEELALDEIQSRAEAARRRREAKRRKRGS